VAGKIYHLERLRNSYSGNPRWAITLEWIGVGTTWHTWNTASDASFNYEIGNKGYRVGDKVRLTIGGRGTVVAIDSQTDGASGVERAS
jgi:hypothetical protein